jgi:hypothetical protein
MPLPVNARSTRVGFYLVAETESRPGKKAWVLPTMPLAREQDSVRRPVVEPRDGSDPARRVTTDGSKAPRLFTRISSFAGRVTEAAAFP